MSHGHYSELGVTILSFLNLGINIMATALISYKIWTTSRLARALGDEKITIRFGRTWMITYAILHVLSSPVAFLLLPSLPVMAGIASILVNVRVGLGWASGEEGRSVRTFAHSSLDESEFYRRESFME
ncbi:hypothetical protein D9756_008543 [Leucocoprinus leucothites]|uniref:Uncharacterized protein n=1 Tax=Leucocoprinus leucothites TaxID=201217 RepID=A0A8H5D0J2_9AGAR|nr:hypothetical protein D9756_008543 [Leucoagaricus leucothites]